MLRIKTVHRRVVTPVMTKKKGTRYFPFGRVSCPQRGNVGDGTPTLLRCGDHQGRAGGAEGGSPGAHTGKEDGGSPERQDPRGIRTSGMEPRRYTDRSLPQEWQRYGFLVSLVADLEGGGQDAKSELGALAF